MLWIPESAECGAEDWTGAGGGGGEACGWGWGRQGGVCGSDGVPWGLCEWGRSGRRQRGGRQVLGG